MDTLLIAIAAAVIAFTTGYATCAEKQMPAKYIEAAHNLCVPNGGLKGLSRERVYCVNGATFKVSI